MDFKIMGNIFQNFTRNVFFSTVLLLLLGCSNGEKLKQIPINDIKSQTKNAEKSNEIKRYYVKIINSIAHDPKAYTQGLQFHNGHLYESTGQYGHSSLRETDPKTGKIIKQINLPDRYFAEGITIVDNKIYLLTWQELTCFVYDINTFRKIKEFQYQGEGWGLVSYKESIILSDGTNFLKFVNPANFRIEKTLSVLENSRVIENLNELEIINNEIWSNIYMTDLIAIINPESGNVTGYIDASILRTNLKDNPDAEVLNGIAYDSTNNKIYLTGKYWNKIFEIELIEQ